MTRLTRKERQERTRSHLMAAAGRVFACHGMHGASVAQVAEEAGYTKGAVYANFTSKEELFLALLEERFADRQRALEELLVSGGDLRDKARAGGEDFMAYLRRDPEWDRLFVEFTAHAARDEAFRKELHARWAAMVEQMGRAIETSAREMNPSLAAYAQPFALMIFAAANGVAFQRLVTDDDLPDGLLADMLELLALGLIARHGT